ncbi:MAG: 4-hydroxy-3-methylbut-2-enyl diphosphate reductase [Endomicrobium sp.]|jgi:4-hydroxy-3-methylbut-2-enyl diphosphate reductase|nr:4-hydroxy-3-methylbut-2-enyl diphosphate reductase [Endomicrobium sp.]
MNGSRQRLKIRIANSSGFCFGVKRAVNLAEEAVEKGRKVYALGPIIHNPQEVERLKKKRIKILADINKIESGFIVLRTHGIPLNIHKKLIKNKNISIIDATCPFVKRAQIIIKQLSTGINFKNKIVIIVGEKIHPEVVALMSYGKSGKCVVVENEMEARNFKGHGDLNIVSQTTQAPENFENIVEILKKQHKVKVHNTICKATFDRQRSAEKLAKSVDLMIVIGGKNSGNTTRLAQICSTNTNTYHIETVNGIKEKWLKNIGSVGLTAGASTPDWIIKEVEKKIKEISV